MKDSSVVWISGNTPMIRKFCHEFLIRFFVQKAKVSTYIPTLFWIFAGNRYWTRLACLISLCYPLPTLNPSFSSCTECPCLDNYVGASRCHFTDTYSKYCIPSVWVGQIEFDWTIRNGRGTKLAYEELCKIQMSSLGGQQQGRVPVGVCLAHVLPDVRAVQQEVHRLQRGTQCSLCSA